jgi:hypothetical protein
MREKSNSFQFPIIILGFQLPNLLHGSQFTLTISLDALFHPDAPETATT